MNAAWCQDRFTGFFRDFQRVVPRPHDPQVSVYAAIAPHWHPEQKGELHVGGCEWSDDLAASACAGEAIERLFAYPTKQDAAIESSYDDWPLNEPAVAPERWVLFHPQQYALDNFPFEAFTRQTRCRWICFREALSGEPHWVPEEFAYLYPRPGCGHRFCPATSTGLAAGTAGQAIVLRALQEVIERDALLGAWWGAYPLEEYPVESAWSAEQAVRLQRPNLRWRFFRIRSPIGNHITMVTLEGEDREGFCFSIGSACRESRRASWNKATLEAVQGRHYVRHLRSQSAAEPSRPLTTFADHAVYYSFHPHELQRTILSSALATSKDPIPTEENLSLLCERLAPLSPVLVRNLTPPILLGQGLDWRVTKVIVPGLQPLHGDERFAHRGGRHWSPRPLDEWNTMPPHPFP